MADNAAAGGATCLKERRECRQCLSHWYLDQHSIPENRNSSPHSHTHSNPYSNLH